MGVYEKERGQNSCIEVQVPGSGVPSTSRLGAYHRTWAETGRGTEKKVSWSV